MPHEQSAPSAAATVSDREQIRLLLARVNEAWLRGDPAELPNTLSKCFRDDVVVRGPDFRELARGREACVKSYADFVRQAQIRNCSLSDPEIDVLGDAAVASYSWQMTYFIEGGEHREHGHDLFVLTRSDGRWLTAWRTVLVAAGQ